MDATAYGADSSPSLWVSIVLKRIKRRPRPSANHPSWNGSKLEFFWLQISSDFRSQQDQIAQMSEAAAITVDAAPEVVMATADAATPLVAAKVEEGKSGETMEEALVTQGKRRGLADPLQDHRKAGCKHAVACDTVMEAARLGPCWPSIPEDPARRHGGGTRGLPWMRC